MISGTDAIVICVGLPAELTAAVYDLVAGAATVVVAEQSMPANRRAGWVNEVLWIDAESRRVQVGLEELHLSILEFDLLTALASERGRVWSYAELSDEVWHQPYFGDPDAIAATARRLRSKVSRTSVLAITNVRGIGYRLDPVQMPAATAPQMPTAAPIRHQAPRRACAPGEA